MMRLAVRRRHVCSSQFRSGGLPIRKGVQSHGDSVVIQLFYSKILLGARIELHPSSAARERPSNEETYQSL
jgi:hypothetical protein